MVGTAATGAASTGADAAGTTSGSNSGSGSGDGSGSSGEARPVYSYNSGEGERKQKATIEHIFTAGVEPTGPNAAAADDADALAAAPARADGAEAASTSGRESPRAPWAVGWQMSERNIVWSDDLKMRLVRVREGAAFHLTSLAVV